MKEKNLKNKSKTRKTLQKIPYKFGSYLECAREKRNISREELCEGICDARYLERIEKGELIPDFMLQNTLLERLGVGVESHEKYLGAYEYERWETQMHIFYAIAYGKWQEATEWLESYRNENAHKADNPLDKQFVLGMKGQILRNTDADRKELQKIYREALELTVQGGESTPITNKVLSLKEINLLLELERLREDGGRRERYLEIMSYVERFFDSMGIVKIYPKAVYLLCRTVGAGMSVKERLKYCDAALEYLRDNSRLYYIWEIFELRDELLEKWIVGLVGDSYEMKDELCELQAQNRLWMEALGKVFDEFGVRKETLDDSYLYVIKGAYNIGEVIQMRRRMLGISREELCGNIRSVRTLQRIERGQIAPCRTTREAFFEGLGLPKEYARDNFLTEVPGIQEQNVKLRRLVNMRQWKEADEVLQTLKQEISEDDRYNRQALLQTEALIKCRMQEISQEEYAEKTREALELTMPLETFLREGDKYLTYQEQLCIMHLMQCMDRSGREFQTCITRFEEYYRKYENSCFFRAVDGAYAAVMGNMASELGNMGEYLKANKYDDVMIEGYLISGKMHILPHALYDRWWNCKTAMEKGTPIMPDMNLRSELNVIVQLANLDKQYKREKMYRSKL